MAISSIPAPTTRLAPKRALSQGVLGATMIMMGAIGRKRTRGRERRVAEHELEVLRHQEHDAVHREEHEHHAAASGAEAPVAEEADVEHRLVGVQLPQHEEREHHERDRRTR